MAFAIFAFLSAVPIDASGGMDGRTIIEYGIPFAYHHSETKAVPNAVTETQFYMLNLVANAVIIFAATLLVAYLARIIRFDSKARKKG